MSTHIHTKVGGREHSMVKYMDVCIRLPEFKSRLCLLLSLLITQASSASLLKFRGLSIPRVPRTVTEKPLRFL